MKYLLLGVMFMMTMSVLIYLGYSKYTDAQQDIVEKNSEQITNLDTKIKTLKAEGLELKNLNATLSTKNEELQAKLSAANTSLYWYKSIRNSTSIQSWQEKELITRVTPNWRYRASYIDELKVERGPKLLIEKIFTPSFGTPADVVYSTEIYPHTYLGKDSKEPYLSLCGGAFTTPEGQVMEIDSCSAGLSCCQITGLVWEGFILKYSMQVGDRELKCEVEGLTENKAEVSCN